MKPNKCAFFKDRIAYLEHIVSKEGIEVDPSKITAIQKWPRPKTITDVRSFPGFTNYYRKFMHRYAQISKPLNDLTSGENAKRKNKNVEWTDEHQESFDRLKNLSTSSPVLAYTNYKKPFIVYTDVSERGLGAVSSQLQDNGKESAIAFASRSLSKSEKRYDAHKLEFLALKWAVTDRFHEYLYGGEFDVYMANNPLTYVLTTAKLDATGQRWIAALALYHFRIYYRSGKMNANADALSRIPWKVSKTDKSVCYEPTVVKAITLKSGDIQVPQAEETLVSKAAIFFAPDYVPNMSLGEWRDSQREDTNIAKILTMMEKGQLEKYRPKMEDSEEIRNYLKFQKYLLKIDGILHRTVQLKHQVHPVNQLVLPYRFRKRMVLACHDELGHLGMDRTLAILQNRVYWPGMSRDIREHIRTCVRCERFKQQASVEEITQTVATYPLELVHADFLTIGGKKDVRKDINIIVVTDHFTRFARAYVTSSLSAATAAKKLFEEYFTQYGWPTKLITDQGGAFESKLFKALMSEAGVKKIQTTPYCPQGNAQCERFNRTLIGMLGTMPVESKKEWQEWVSAMTHAYNCTVSKTTGYSPYFLMYGQEPQLPIDKEFNLPNNREPASIDSYVERLLNKVDYAFQKARENSAKDAANRKKYYDKNVTCHALEPGNIVLVYRKIFSTDYKIADKWEDEPYVVVSQMGDTPVFKVRLQEKPNAECRVLHRNMLHPARSVSTEKTEAIVSYQSILSKANALMDAYFDV